MTLNEKKEKKIEEHEKAFNDLLKHMRKNSSFKAIMEKHKIKKEEIKAHLFDFFLLYNNLSKLHVLPVMINVNRDKNKKLYFEQVFSNNDVGKEAKIKYNSWFTDISEIDYSASYEKIMERNDSRRRITEYMIKLDGYLAVNNNFDGFKGFYIFGESGVGKTFILSIFAKYFALKNFKIAYIQLPKLFAYIKKEIPKKNNNLDDIKTKLIEVDFLFLDDLGDERDNIWFRTEFLAQVINDRYESKKITFFASSMSTIELEKLYQRQNSSVIHILQKMISKIVRQIIFQEKLTL